MKPRLRILFTCILISYSIASAQNATLRGKVIDGENGEPLTGATVFIIGTYKGAYADDNGNFQITDIKPGDYSVRFSYVGYAEKIYNGVSFEPGTSKTLDVTLVSAVSTLGEVEIVGERRLVDLESGRSQVRLTDEQIGEMSALNVQDVIATQVGVNITPDGLQIRGGRVYETEYLVDGINAQDPLAGTGFGVDVNTRAIKEVELITGGSGAEYGNGTSGVVITKIKEGSRDFKLDASYRRDNLGFNKNQGSSWNTDEGSISLSGPIIRDKLTFFASGSVFLTDNYYRFQADQLRSSLFENDSIWAPRQDNRWSHTLKLAWSIHPGWKLTFTNQHSLNINQSTRSLQIIGNDEVVRPGFQYPFSLDLDNANTYTHHSNLSIANLIGVLGEQWTFSLSAGRLFTNLRADANGRPFRTETVDQIFDPSSIVTDPVSVFNPQDDVVFVFPGPGLINNGGIATLWHDHYAREYTIKTRFNYQSRNEIHYFRMGQSHKFQTYQWIDVTRPWVGAPIRINDTLTTPSTRLGRSSDFWKVNPMQGGIFFQDEIRYQGVIATLGMRFNYWAISSFVDDAIDNPDAPILDAVREGYKKETVKLFGLRWKARLLPRINVSFPVTENNVLYFNYSHSMRLPHPRFLYAGLDPVFQDRSFLADLGNPNLNPEVSVSYEIGMKSQLTKDLAMTIAAFYNDRFDYIVSRRIEVRDATGRFVEKTFFINQDYARIRGLELGLTRRFGKSFTGIFSGSYSIATGKSNTATESALQIRQQGFVNATQEQPLAWDRPLDLKLLLIFTPDSSVYLGNFPLKGFRATLTGTYKSGLRYTPYELVRINEGSGRPEYEPIQDRPLDEVGKFWSWVDLKLSKDFYIGNTSRLSLQFEVRNLFNYRSPVIINGVTGDAYREGDPLPLSFRDPQYPDPQDRGLPPFNPARFMAPRQTLFGLEVKL